MDPVKKNTSRTIGLSDGLPLAYSLAAGAAAAVLGGEADASVRYSSLVDIEIGQGLAQSLDMNLDGFEDILLKNYIFAGGNYQGAIMKYAPGAFVGTAPTAFKYVSALEYGSLVDASTVNYFVGSMSYGVAYNLNPNAEFDDVENAYIGLGFVAGSDVHYGWIRVSVDNLAGMFTIHDWAYELIPGESITTGKPGEIAGDFNNDGVVNAADYTVYRDSVGMSLDFNGAGEETGTSFQIVDADDYQLWVDNFGFDDGLMLGPSAFAVPEPGTLGFLAAGSLGILALRRRKE